MKPLVDPGRAEGSGSKAPSVVLGQSPWWGSGDEAPLKLKAFHLFSYKRGPKVYYSNKRKPVCLVHRWGAARSARPYLDPVRWQSISLSGACQVNVAVSTSSRHADLSVARRFAVARPKLSGRRSSSTVFSQVCLGLPTLRRQSFGGPKMQARRAL